MIDYNFSSEKNSSCKARELINIINCSFKSTATQKITKNKDFFGDSTCLSLKTGSESAHKGNIKSLSPRRENSYFNDDPYKYDDIRRLRSEILMTRHDHVTRILNIGSFFIDDKFKSPSPPPIYDPNTGQRTNTREQRIRLALDLERRVCMHEASKINPDIKMPTNFRPVNKEINIFIPQKDHPGYNFIGLILGPRGCMQKRLEYETGAKITIRGKGALKDTRQEMWTNNGSGSNVETHVHIDADSWDKVDAAIELIEPLLTYIEEEENIHKRNQMLQIAKNNGSLQLNQFENDKAGELMLIKQLSGPLGSDRKGIFQIPEHLREKMEEQYRRDVAAMKGFEPISMEEQLEQFMLGLDTTYKKNKGSVKHQSPMIKHSFGPPEHKNKQLNNYNHGTYQTEMKSVESKISPYGGFSPLLQN